MRNTTKRWIIAGVAVVAALGMLTACTKITEKKEDAEEAADELPPSDEAENDEKTSDTGEGDGESVLPGEETALEGRIEEIPEDSDDSFLIAKLVKEEADGMTEIGDDPDGTKITVVYSMDTKFVKQTWGSGVEDREETEGSAADLRKDLLVEMTGSYYDEKTFFATEIRVVEIV